MLAKNCTIAELNSALEKVNEKFDDNIRFKRIEQTGKNIRFTLTVNNSKSKGGRIGHSGKRVAAACWHAHGTFFDSLLQEVNHNALIVIGDKKVYALGDNDELTVFGNWEDRNIGSRWMPLYYSEACECDK